MKTSGLWRSLIRGDNDIIDMGRGKVNLVIIGSQLVWKAHSKGLVVGAGGETSVAAKIVRFPLVEFSTMDSVDDWSMSWHYHLQLSQQSCHVRVGSSMSRLS